MSNALEIALGMLIIVSIISLIRAITRVIVEMLWFLLDKAMWGTIMNALVFSGGCTALHELDEKPTGEVQLECEALSGPVLLGEGVQLLTRLVETPEGSRLRFNTLEGECDVFLGTRHVKSDEEAQGEMLWTLIPGSEGEVSISVSVWDREQRLIDSKSVTLRVLASEDYSEACSLHARVRVVSLSSPCRLLSRDIEGVIIETGDGRSESSRSEHSYSQVGEYDVTYRFSRPLVEIGESMFEGTHLIGVQIGSSVERLGERCFSQCMLLESVEIAPGVKEISKEAFAYAKALHALSAPHTLETLGEGVFYGCESLERLDLSLCPLGQIPAWTLFDCVSLRELSLPQSVEIIGDSALQNCKSLEGLILPAALKQIRAAALSRCMALKEIDFPSELQYLGHGAFYRCVSLRKVSLPQTLQETGYTCFSGCLSLTALEAPGVERVGADAFSSCPQLQRVVLPQARNLGVHAFEFDAALEQLTLPKIESIQDECFDECSKLSSVELGENLSLLADRAFSQCGALQSIRLHALQPASRGQEVFHKCTSLTRIWVPQASLEQYLEHWKDVREIVAGYE